VLLAFQVGVRLMAKKKTALLNGMAGVIGVAPGLEKVLQKIAGQFGDGAIMSVEGEELDVECISTGSLSLDLALGKGMPRGRIVEVFGPESSGKTTLALQMCAKAQEAGGLAALIDVEHAFDPTWAKRLGVKLDTFLISQPDSAEEALTITAQLVESGQLDVVVVDSVAALVPRVEFEGEMGQSHVGLQARLMSQAMRKLVGVTANSKTVLVFINQIRQKVGVMFGSPETTSGGLALKFAASVRLDVRRIGQLKDGEIPVGQRTRCKVVKNKVAPPMRVAEFDIMYDSGLSVEGDIIDLGLSRQIITKSGAWLSYGGRMLGQGKEKVRSLLKDDKALAEEIAEAIRAGGYAKTGDEDASEES
jgi:recombination protein RecA